jgi:nucleoside phosphorylase
VILVLAATERELAGAAEGAVLCGSGPVDAAAAAAAAIAEHRPAAVLNVGIAGARRGCGLEPPALVIGSGARYADATGKLTVRVVDAAPDLVEAARRALPQAQVLPIATSARVGGGDGCDVEAMEGFAVLRAAELAGVPAVEVRAIANEIEEEDRRAWRFDEAFEAIAAATPRVLAEIEKCVS